MPNENRISYKFGELLEGVKSLFRGLLRQLQKEMVESKNAVK